MDLDVRTPRSDAVVSAEAEAPGEELAAVETRPGAYARGVSVSSDEIAIVYGLTGKRYGLAGIEGDVRSPQHADADFAGMVDERGMQRDTAQADSLPRREIGRDSRAVITKADPTKGRSVVGVQFDS
jgi:hypothetical protein